MTSALTQMVVLFIVLALGYVGNKAKVLNADSNRLLSRLVLNITMPCTVLYSVMNGAVTATGREALLFILLSLVSFAVIYNHRLAGAAAAPVPAGGLRARPVPAGLREHRLHGLSRHSGHLRRRRAVLCDAFKHPVSICCSFPWASS